MSHWSKMFTEDSPMCQIWSRLHQLLPTSPPAKRRRREMLSNPRAARLLSPKGRRDFTSRKNIPGKLPTFLLALLPSATALAECRAASHVRSHCPHQGLQETLGREVADAINSPFYFCSWLFKPLLLYSYFLCGPSAIILQFKESL